MAKRCDECECCDSIDTADRNGQIVAIVLFTLLLSFLWTDGWRLLDRACP